MEVLSVISSQLTIPKMIETFFSKESMGLFYIRLTVKAMLVSITLGTATFHCKIFVLLLNNNNNKNIDNDDDNNNVNNNNNNNNNNK